MHRYFFRCTDIFFEVQIYLLTFSQQRLLYNLGLKRTNIDYNREDVRAAIVSYCNGAGSSGGYRSVWHALRIRGLVVPASCRRNI